MKKIFLILGNDKENLYGSRNDAILIYNFIYNYFINNSDWYKPIMLLDDNINLKNLNKIKNLKIDKIYFYFSGHSNIKGKVKFNNNFLSCKSILKHLGKINKCKDIFFILDSCYGEYFKENNKNFNNIYFLSASNKDQLSKEILTNYDEKKYSYIKPNILKKNVIHGIFTYNLHKFLNKINFNDFNSWKEILNNPIWTVVEIQCNQTINFNFFSNHK